MIPTIVGEGSTDAVTAVDDVVPTNPASLAIDDILVAWVVSGDDTGNVVFPAGWTEQDETPDNDPTGAKAAIAWRRVTNADESDDAITITYAGNTTQMYAGIFAMRGCETAGDPFDSFIRVIGDGVIVMAMAAITTTGTDRKLIAVGVIEDNRAVADDATDYTRQFQGTTTVGSDAGYAVFYQDAATAQAYAADTATATANSENHVSWTIDFKPVSSALDQEGFRFRDDDDNEADANWRQNQDVNDSIAKDTNFRLRVLLNSAGDEPTRQYQLEYKENGDSDVEYRKVKL